MKKQTRLILIAVCLLTMVCVVAFASCKSTQITVTVDLNLPDTANPSFKVDKEAEFYSMLESYVPSNTDGMTFVGWVDENGDEVTSVTRWDKDGTVCAVWNVEYSIEYYLETNDGFVKSDEYSSSKVGKLGATVTAEQIGITGYTFDSANANNTQSATLAAGTVLKLYYKRTVYTVTFNKNYAQATGEMAVLSCHYGEMITLTANTFESNYEFGGWSTQPNGLGDYYPDKFETSLTDDLTLYAQWRVSYTEEIYVEKFNGSDYVYVLEKTSTQDGFLGNSISMRTRYDEPHYFLDYSHADCITGTPNLADGAVLKAYYSLELMTVTYVDDNTSVEVRYGGQYTIRTPEQDGQEGQVAITSYCISPTGDGTEYKFGQTITVTDNLTLYPVIVAEFTDVEGSGDKVEIRAGVKGKGTAVLVKGGNRYSGFVNELSESFITFDVTVDETELHGRLLDNGKFVYRNEDEEGTYLYGNHLYPANGVNPFVMLALNGYGTGVYSYMLDDDSGRTVNYYVNYELTEYGDYSMEYYLPANPDQVFSGYFKIVREHIEGAEQIGENVVGYFMLCGQEIGGYIRVDNGSVQTEYVLQLDGYGSFKYYFVNGEDYEVETEGVYMASAGYSQDLPEYVLYSDNDNSDINGNMFILFSQKNPNNGETYPLFSFKHDEVGSYVQNVGSDFPELYLDGYGGAMYFSSLKDNGTYGTYTIQTLTEGYEVYVIFSGENAGTLRAVIDRSSKTFTVKDNNFRVNENGVLTEYLGNSAVIVVPEQVDGITVTEIANGVFNTQANGKYYTSVTLPATITTIGERAFQNDHYLIAVYISATTPPVLGLNAFHWMRSDLLIVVPDGCEDVYRNAESWAPYDQYITSEYELAHKPLFEIVDGVLKSYNPIDKSVTNITIPDEVTAIANGVFAYREYITSVNLNNVTVIGDNAFDSCVNLASVTFNADTVSIGKEAFFNCAKLTRVNLGNVQTIGDSAFNCCYSLSGVDIGNAITQIGTMAFAYCANTLDSEGETVSINDLTITITATSAPQMANKVFINSAPRIYVNSYEVGVNYAQDASANWSSYVRYLRVKNQGENQTFYSVANMANCLVLDDRAMYGESITGLYKWDGNTLTIAWLNRDSFTGNFSVDVQTASFNSVNGELRGLQHENEPLVFVVRGTVVTYTREEETLTVKFGTDEATFNGHAVTMEIVNYRMRFNYDGYVYALTLYNTNEFSYTRSKIEIVKNYTAEDGSSIEVTYGNYIKAIGTIKDVNGEEVTVLKHSDWYLTQVADNVYTWTISRQSTKYLVTATLNDEDNTFTYIVGPFSAQTRYNNGSDYVIVTAYTDGHLEIHFSFATANGNLQCNVMTVTPVAEQQNAYYVTISIMVDVYNDEGDVIGQEPSVFDGDYTVTLNSADSTYTLQRVQNA